MRYVPEREYIEHLDGVLGDLAGRIAGSGLSHSEIAAATRMSRSTVRVAALGRPVSFVNAQRIIYFLNQYHATNKKETAAVADRAEHRPDRRAACQSEAMVAG